MNEDTIKGNWNQIKGKVVDLKTISKADPRTITRQSYDYGYAQQADFYRRGIHAVTGQWLPFVHVFVESDEPHIVHVAQQIVGEGFKEAKPE